MPSSLLGLPRSGLELKPLIGVERRGPHSQMLSRGLLDEVDVCPVQSRWQNRTAAPLAPSTGWTVETGLLGAGRHRGSPRRAEDTPRGRDHGQGGKRLQRPQIRRAMWPRLLNWPLSV